MKRYVSLVAAAACCASLSLSAMNVSIVQGWQMLGTPAAILDSNLSQIFPADKVKAVWAYDKTNKKWKVYSSNSEYQQALTTLGIDSVTSLAAYEGFWVQGLTNSTITLPDCTLTSGGDTGGSSGGTTGDQAGWLGVPTFTAISYASGVTLGNVTSIADGEYRLFSNMTLRMTDGNGSMVVSDKGKEFTALFKVVNNELNISAPNMNLSYGLLAANDQGYVFGLKGQLSPNSFEGPGVIFGMVSNSATPIALNSNTLPSKLYAVDPLENAESVEIDLNQTHLKITRIDGQYHVEPYVLKDGKITTHTDFSYSSGNREVNDHNLTVLAKLDQYIIASHEIYERHEESSVCDNNQTCKPVADLFGSESKNWSTLLTKTSGQFNGDRMTISVADKNGTFTIDNREVFKISFNDDLTVGTIVHDGGTETFTIDGTNNKIITEWRGAVIQTWSTTPVLSYSGTVKVYHNGSSTSKVFSFPKQ